MKFIKAPSTSFEAVSIDMDSNCLYKTGILLLSCLNLIV